MSRADEADDIFDSGFFGTAPAAAQPSAGEVIAAGSDALSALGSIFDAANSSRGSRVSLMLYGDDDDDDDEDEDDGGRGGGGRNDAGDGEDDDDEGVGLRLMSRGAGSDSDADSDYGRERRGRGRSTSAPPSSSSSARASSSSVPSSSSAAAGGSRGDKVRSKSEGADWKTMYVNKFGKNRRKISRERERSGEEDDDDGPAAPRVVAGASKLQSQLRNGEFS